MGVYPQPCGATGKVVSQRIEYVVKYADGQFIHSVSLQIQFRKRVQTIEDVPG